MSTWFTADLHLGHEMVTAFRGFKTITQHDRAVIRNYNDLVGDDDTVYIVGDLCMWGPQNIGNAEAYVRKLKGRKHLILGNHDKLKPFDYVEIGIISVHTSLVLDKEFSIPNPILINHDPAAVTVDPNGRWVCGHVHSLFKQIGTCLNVGVDVWGLKPVDEETVRELLEKAVPTEEQKNMKHLSENRHNIGGVEDGKEAQEG